MSRQWDKISATVVFGVFMFVANAWGVPPNRPAQPKDHYLMEEGRIQVVVNGDKSLLSQDLVLSNGTRIQMDGTVTLTSEVRFKLKQGEMLSLEGEKFQQG